MPSSSNRIVLTGPTGSGKSALALEIAETIGAEIVSIDSMALYRGFDIGTAKPTLPDQQRVPHHLIDVLEPHESGSVAWWLERALAVAAEIESRGRNVLFVGGTPLYLKALLRGLFDGPPRMVELRRRLEDEAAREGVAMLHARLATVDPAAAKRIHPNDLRRIVRALEVFEATGRAISEQQTEWAGVAASGPEVVCLDVPREELRRRIDARVETMLAAGWLDEARRLRERNPSREASAAVGYRELWAFLEGNPSWDETVERIRRRTWQYARRQLTWFRGLPEVQFATVELTRKRWHLTIDEASADPPDRNLE